MDNKKFTRYELLCQERAEIEQESRLANEELHQYGEYGQVPQRLADKAADKEYILKLWDEEFDPELKELKKLFKSHNIVMKANL